MISLPVLLIFTTTLTAILVIGLALEVRKNLTLVRELVDLNSAIDRVEMQAEVVTRRQRYARSHVDKVLAVVELQRDIREPAHEILEYLAIHGPSTTYELIDEFGPYAGRQLGELLTEGGGYLRTDDDHHVWWVERPQNVTTAPGCPQETFEAPGAGPDTTTLVLEASDGPNGSPVESLSEWLQEPKVRQVGS